MVVGERFDDECQVCEDCDNKEVENGMECKVFVGGGNANEETVDVSIAIMLMRRRK